jgi:hypothetical protein
VLFDVNPVNAGGQYIARAFFPSQSRYTRNVLIDNSAFTSGGDPSLTGVLRHELGHTLGFRHEHTRPEAGTCFEDNSWRTLTTYDQASVMHYPQCNGISSWALELSAKDAQGAALLYGAHRRPPPTDPSTPRPRRRPAPPPTGHQRQRRQERTTNYGPTRGPGQRVPGDMTGTGGPQTYTSLRLQAANSAYDCSPTWTAARPARSPARPGATTPTMVWLRRLEVQPGRHLPKRAAAATPAPTYSGTVMSTLTDAPSPKKDRL